MNLDIIVNELNKAMDEERGYTDYCQWSRKGIRGAVWIAL